MRTKGENGALRAIVGSVVGASHKFRSRFITFGVTVAVAVGIAVSSIPNMVGIFCSSTCLASSVGIGANFFDELAVLLQQFINLRLLLVDLGLLFSDDLQQIVIFSRHMLYVRFVGSCRYCYFVEIGC